MANRNLRDTRFEAKRLYVDERRNLTEIAHELGIHITTLRRWIKKEHWDIPRNEPRDVLPVRDQLNKLISEVALDINQKHKEGLPVSDILLNRLERLTRIFDRYNSGFNEREAILVGMGKFIEYLRVTKNYAVINILADNLLEEFYRWAFPSNNFTNTEEIS